MKRIIAGVFLLPTLALAQETNQVSYDYFDVDYFRTDWDSGTDELDGSGWAGRFSVGIREHVFIGGEYRAWDIDGVEGGSTYKRLGFGVHGALNANWSLFGEVGFKSLDLDLGLGNVEDDPGYIAGGARWYVADGYELRLSADWSEAGKGTPVGVGETTLSFGGDVYMTETAALSFEFQENDDNTTTFMIGMRFYHKKDPGAMRQYR